MICFGLGCFCFAVATNEGKGVKPYFLLDVVLTPEELKDREARDRTLEILKKAAGSGPGAGTWVVVGIAISLASAIGYWSVGGQVDPKGIRPAGAGGP